MLREDASPPAEVASPLVVSRACLPSAVRIPVRADLEWASGEREPRARYMRFLRPVCVADTETTRCRETPDLVTLSNDAATVHGDGLALVSLVWTGTGAEERLVATFVRFEPQPLGRSGPIAEDCCDALAWSRDGSAPLSDVEGDVGRANDRAPWTFVPRKPVCTADHAPGDDRVLRAFSLRGDGAKMFAEHGTRHVFVSGTLRRTASVAEPFVADVRQVAMPNLRTTR